MRKMTTEKISVISKIICDRCGTQAKRRSQAFHEMTSIHFTAGHGSVFGNGTRIEIDLCDSCLLDTLGPWLRGKEYDSATTQEEKLKLFDQKRHGGEFPLSEGRRMDKTLITAESQYPPERVEERHKPAYERDDGPLTKKQFEEICRIARKRLGKRPVSVRTSLLK